MLLKLFKSSRKNTTKTTKAQNTVTFPELVLDKFSGNDPDQDAKSFLTTVENKINFSLGSEPVDNAELARYTFRKKALFSSLLRGPAAEWYEATVDDATTWDRIKTTFLTRFSNNRERYRHRIDVENCVRGDEELIQNFFHRIKTAVDKGWRNEPGATAAQIALNDKNRNQKYIEFTVRGLKPLALKRKAHEYLIEHPDTTWNNFKTHLTNKDVIYSVSSELAPNSTNDQSSRFNLMGQQIKEIMSLLKEQQFNLTSQVNHFIQKDVNNKSRQPATRFCLYCRRNGHTIQFCRNKASDDEFRRQQARQNQERKQTFTHDYNRRKGPNFGAQNFQNQSQPPRYGHTFQQNRPQNGFRHPRPQFNQERRNPTTNNGTNFRPSHYNFNTRSEISESQYNRNFPQNNATPSTSQTPNTVQFVESNGNTEISSITNFFPLNY